MGPESPLPVPQDFDDADTYVSSLLKFATTSQLLQTLCGGVHILDFLTRSPELYSVILPESWRLWFADVEVDDVLDLLMREALNGISSDWRGYEPPPASLIEYIQDVRRHLLCRDFESPQTSIREPTTKQVFMGMSPKKVHEVGHFASYVDNLASALQTGTTGSVTHLADFGAGQNYLGRVLASKPYDRNIIAIESRAHVVAGARNLDVQSKVTPKTVFMRNKKAYRAAMKLNDGTHAKNGPKLSCDDQELSGHTDTTSRHAPAVYIATGTEMATSAKPVKTPSNETGMIQYVEHRIRDGDLSSVVEHIAHKHTQLPAAGNNASCIVPPTSQQEPSLLVMSLHSCGNLVHHGLRTLTLNPSVKAIALIGCCYNMMTERLGPPTHKVHSRSEHPRLDATAGAYDPHGFPMSERFASHKHSSLSAVDFSRMKYGHEDTLAPDELETGIRLNITARMMSVQAPQNWTESESAAFFTRHFFRALLQRIFLDKGVVDAPPSHSANENMGCSPAGSSWGMTNGDGDGTSPIVIGGLKKKCYDSFTSYVRGAIDKVETSGVKLADLVVAKLGSMSDTEIQEYELRYQSRKKELSIVWSLMAFSAGVVEAMVVVDRWLWLKEQSCVEHAWVEPVFDYAKSPRNLVIVGVKKGS